MTERTPTTKQIAKWLGILGLAYSSSPFREEKKREAESVVQRFTRDTMPSNSIGFVMRLFPARTRQICEELGTPA
jgi:hypothetical protein